MNKKNTIIRCVFIPSKRKPYYKKRKIKICVDGFSTFDEKQKCVQELHKKIKRRYPKLRILEISTKSLQEEGVSMSAFNLKLFDGKTGKKICVENIYHASKVFEGHGPHSDLLEVSPKEAKLDIRISNRDEIVRYEYSEEIFPSKPYDLFFGYIYFTALLDNAWLAQELFKYEAFTDIEFDPKSGVNCQAAEAAKFVGMCKKGISIPKWLRVIKENKKVPTRRLINALPTCELPIN